MTTLRPKNPSTTSPTICTILYNLPNQFQDTIDHEKALKWSYMHKSHLSVIHKQSRPAEKVSKSLNSCNFRYGFINRNRGQGPSRSHLLTKQFHCVFYCFPFLHWFKICGFISLWLWSIGWLIIFSCCLAELRGKEVHCVLATLIVFSGWTPSFFCISLFLKCVSFVFLSFSFFVHFFILFEIFREKKSS